MNRSIDTLISEFTRRKTWLVLSGAGISAASGIPTYRDKEGKWRRNRAIQHREFVQEPASRRRYWARSMIGWPGVFAAQPNAIHQGIADLEHQGRIGGIITQNVDRLHQRAGSQRVVDLHGRLDRVCCLDCHFHMHRETLQQLLVAANPDYRAWEAQAQPDGDADVPDEWVATFTVVDCPVCGGVLMPDVVFFGGSIRGEVLDTCWHWLADAEGILVLGSSLQVFSGFRFAREAKKAGKALIIINDGVTRADDLCDLKLTLDAALALDHLHTALGTHRRVRSASHAQQLA